MAIEIVDFPMKNGGSVHSFLLTFTRPGTDLTDPWQVLTGKPDVISYEKQKDATWRRRRLNRERQKTRGRLRWCGGAPKIAKLVLELL